MAAHEEDAPVMHDPTALLERSLVDEYLEKHGASRLDLPDERTAALLIEARRYASARLAEMEARAHYVHEIHGVRR